MTLEQLFELLKEDIYMVLRTHKWKEGDTQKWSVSYGTGKSAVNEDLKEALLEVKNALGK